MHGEQTDERQLHRPLRQVRGLRSVRRHFQDVYALPGIVFLLSDLEAPCFIRSEKTGVPDEVGDLIEDAGNSAKVLL